jgi:hypothetical protein
MRHRPRKILPRRSAVALGLALVCFVLSCVATSPGSVSRHRWWSGLGPVLPHESFPGDCNLCHVGEKWDTLKEDFTFDHAAETGVPLVGAHQEARCLRCHNDRGPVSVFMARGCAGCHEDIHFGQLGTRCDECHQQETWRPVGQIERHSQTRFPLVGVHAATACHRCHPGAEVGEFVPTDVECVTCHSRDLARAINPPHVGLGLVDNCNRCHIPTTWNQAEMN